MYASSLETLQCGSDPDGQGLGDPTEDGTFVSLTRNSSPSNVTKPLNPLSSQIKVVCDNGEEQAKVLCRFVSFII
jgi:hypothetical protein